MKHRRRNVQAHWRLLALVVPAVFVGCSLVPVRGEPATSGEPEPPVRITRIDGVYENIHPSFWAEGSARRSHALFLNLWVHLDVPSAVRVRPVDVRVYDFLDNFWTVETQGVAHRDGAPFGGWIRLRDHFLSDNGTMLALTRMRVDVELSDGTIVTRPVSFPPPASSTVMERFLVSEEYRGELTREHAFALERAVLLSADLRAGSLHAVFGPVDRRATNGQVVLLGADRTFVGESPEFYNDFSREPRRFLNGGSRLRTSEDNRLELPLDEISWAAGFGPDDVRYLYVKLRDGGQFAFTDRSQSYFHLSRSALFDRVTSAPAE